MSKIVYLLGAGASRGIRTTDNNPNHFEINLGESHIEEGLPLVYEIPDRLDYIINKVKECSISEEIWHKIYPIGERGGTGFNEAREMLLKDLRWLKDQSAAHATIDTFAKKLYLTDKMDDFYKVEMLLSIFFVIEQIINKPDGRYDTFLASVLTSRLELPENIAIVTWNYDSQFEMAYKEYENRSYDELRLNLKICDLKDDSENRYKDSCNKIFKVNGTANFMKSLPITSYKDLTDECLNVILNHYMKDKKNPMGTRLSFAWEFGRFKNGKLNSFIKEAVKDAEVLVVIGYTFPFFNREIDRNMIGYMRSLKKIYIQDPNAENIKQNLLPVLLFHEEHQYLYEHISLITNTSQFFLPPEL